MATISLGFYLLKRIQEVGVGTIFGVPGDFNLQLLDHVYNVPGLKWVGNANELNAAYAADGYARVKNVPGCLITTHGVGELSALNGIAGSMAEQIKIIHVVGQTTRTMQKNRMMIHHSIGFDPDHQIFNKASKGFRVAAAELHDKESAPAEIDRVIRECFIKSHPVYIFLPLDLVDEQVPSNLLNTPIDLSFPVNELTKRSTDDAAMAIIEALAESKNPVVFVDCLVERHHALPELITLLDKLALPIYTSNLGKGLVDEDHPNHVGIYNGKINNPGLAEAFEQSDLILVFGSLPSDTNSGGFSRKISPETSIDIAPTHVTIKGSTKYSDIYIKPLLVLLTERIDTEKLPKVEMPSLPVTVLIDEHHTDKITQTRVWTRIAEYLEPGDVILGETGTAAFGLLDGKFPRNTRWHSQIYYGSIGHATPAALGSELALAEMSSENSGNKRGRTVLVTGDGSLQMTVQEIGTMIAQKTHVVIFVINNSGYTVERVIHGARQPYNDIAPWNYSYTLRLFGMSEEVAQKSTFRVETKKELDEVLTRPDVRNPKNVILVEVMVAMMEAPWRMLEQVASRGPEVRKDMEDAGFKMRGPVIS